MLHGDDIAEAKLLADELEQSEGMVFVPPYDDPHIIAGQGTVALELLEDAPDLDVLVVPDRRRRPPGRHGRGGRATCARTSS